MSTPSSRSAFTSDSHVRASRTAGVSNEISERSSPSRRRVNQSSADKATAAFVRRTLCAHQIQASGDKGRNTPKPIEELLPPLTSSNDIDLELYAFIAIIIKDFVNPWYTKITPDHVFTDEVVQVIAHCTRQLEQRLRHIDTEALLLDDLPQLLNSHISGTAQQSSLSSPGVARTCIRCHRAGTTIAM